MEKDESTQIVDESVIMTKFRPLEAELHRMAEESKSVTASDFADKEKMALVKSSQLGLRDMRTSLEKLGKWLRDPHTQFNRNALAEENRLIAIIDPEEKRLKAIRAEADKLAEREARKALHPMRIAQLNAVCETLPDEDFLLEMDTNQFAEYLNQQTALKNERDRLAFEEHRRKADEALEAERQLREREIAERNAELDARQKAIDEETERIVREGAMEDAKEKARVEAVAREREAKAAEEAERVEIAKREAEMAERKAREEKEALEARKKYQNFLTKYEYVDDGSFKVENDGKVVTLYKVLGTMKI